MSCTVVDWSLVQGVYLTHSQCSQERFLIRINTQLESADWMSCISVWNFLRKLELQEHINDEGWLERFGFRLLFTFNSTQFIYLPYWEYFLKFLFHNVYFSICPNATFYHMTRVVVPFYSFNVFKDPFHLVFKCSGQARGKNHVPGFWRPFLLKQLS